MARRVFFSFHYQRDIWRVNQVRNSWIVRPGEESANFWDQSLWEEAKLKGCSAAENLENPIVEYHESRETRADETETPQFQCAIQIRDGDGSATWGEKRGASVP